MDNLFEMFPSVDRGFIQSLVDERGIESAAAFLLDSDTRSGNAEQNLIDPDHVKHPPSDKFEDNWIKADNKPLTHNLQQYVNSEQFADVELVCTDAKTCFAHSVILSLRSEFFMALLATVEPQDDHKGRKVLEVDMNQEKCLLVLRYLYTDNLRIDQKDLMGLYNIAVSMELVGLRSLAEMTQPVSKFSEQMLPLVTNPELYSDVVLASPDGQQLPAHKLLLSAGSTYFKEMFVARFMESSQRVISIPGVTMDDLKAIQSCIYTDGCFKKNTITVENAFPLFLLGNKFLVTALQNYCEEYMSQHLDLDNVLDVFLEGGPLSTSLRQRAMMYLVDHYEEIIQTEQFKALPEQIRLEISQFSANEMEQGVAAMVASLAGFDVDDLRSIIVDEVIEFLDSKLEYVRFPQYRNVVESPLGFLDVTISNLSVTAPPQLAGIPRQNTMKDKVNNAKAAATAARPRRVDSSSEDSSSDTGSDISTSSSEAVSRFFERENLSVEFEAKRIKIVAANIDLHLPKAQWIASTADDFEAEGSVDIIFYGMKAILSFNSDLQLEEFQITVDNVYAEFHDLQADWLREIFYGLVVRETKQFVIDTLTSSFAQDLTSLRERMNRYERQASRSF